jgi:hypothetical protein
MPAQRIAALFAAADEWADREADARDEVERTDGKGRSDLVYGRRHTNPEAFLHAAVGHACGEVEPSPQELHEAQRILNKAIDTGKAYTVPDVAVMLRLLARDVKS